MYFILIASQKIVLMGFYAGIHSNIRAAETEIRKSLSSRDLILRIKHEIYINYFDQLQLSDFAKIFHINPNYLSTLFKKQNGNSFSKYLSSIRIEKAKQYLKYTDFTTDKISELVGYNDRGYFSRQFTEHCSVSPSKYRKEFTSQMMKECDEEYVYVAVFREDPLMIEQDMYGIQYFANDLGDGECNEGSIWESAKSCALLRLIIW